MIPCLPVECTDSAPCGAACTSKGYKGGVCILNVGSNTGACCWKPSFQSQDSSITDDTNVLITN